MLSDSGNNVGDSFTMRAGAKLDDVRGVVGDGGCDDNKPVPASEGSFENGELGSLVVSELLSGCGTGEMVLGQDSDDIRGDVSACVVDVALLLCKLLAILGSDSVVSPSPISTSRRRLSSRQLVPSSCVILASYTSHRSGGKAFSSSHGSSTGGCVSLRVSLVASSWI